MPVHSESLTKLFRALDGDRDGYLLASDLSLLGRVMLGRRVSAEDAKKELQRIKREAQAKIGLKSTFQSDAICLDEFLASGLVLDSMPESQVDNIIHTYVEAINRLTGVISDRELVILRMAREQWNMAQANDRNTGDSNAPRSKSETYS